ncbi:MAG: ferrous iron transport protein B, partial [Myxococcota bacterium]
PVVVALNMVDELERDGHAIDHTRLSALLECPVVPMVASTGAGVDALSAALESLKPADGERRYRLQPEHEAAIEEVGRGGDVSDGVAIWTIGSVALGRPVESEAERAARAQIERHVELPSAIITARQHAAKSISDEVLRRGPERVSRTDRIDAIVLHPLWGLALFALVMFVVFQSIFAWADPAVGAIEALVALAQDGVRTLFGEGALIDLLADGIVGGVGNVIVFVPQIAFLFLFIAVLEDSGYLARVALLSDRVMAGAGLHGRAFVPLLSGFACAIPAIMAARTVEHPRDRLITILVTPLMSCSARLPVYALMIGALFAGSTTVLGVFSLGGAMLFALYALSVVIAVAAAFVLKRFVLRGETPSLVLELPPYRAPRVRGVVRRVFERCWLFVKEAGTVILAISIVLWALLYFPRPQIGMSDAQAVEHSIAGRIGHGIEPAIEPLGYNWQIGVGLLSSFAAREVFVSTMALVHGRDPELDAEDPGLRATIQSVRDPETGESVYTPLTGLSLMVFFLVAMQCMSTLAVIRRETKSWRWPVFALVYMNVLAYGLAFVVYQGGRALGFA